VSPGRPKYPAAARALLRTTLLDAVDHILRDRPWSAVTMAAIAADAGVSRQTVYNEFGGRDGVAQAYVLREAAGFVDAIRGVVGRHAGDPRRALAAAFDWFLTAASDHPVLSAIAGEEGNEELLALLTTQGGPLLESATDQLALVLQETWDGVAIADARAVAECVVRLAISHAALPSGTAAQSAAQIATLLGPYAEQLLSAAAARDAA
jgi:AcrR family transcriptional regulator